MDVPIIGYVMMTFWQFRPNLAPKNAVFCWILQEFCNFSGAWNSLDVPKDTVFAEIFVFSNIFGFRQQILSKNGPML